MPPKDDGGKAKQDEQKIEAVDRGKCGRVRFENQQV